MVEGAADVGRNQLEADGAEESAEHLSRSPRPLFEHLLDVAQPVLDPLDGRRPKDLLAAAADCFYFVAEVVNAALGSDQGLGERLAAAVLADEVDEVGEPTLLSGELRLLELQRVR